MRKPNADSGVNMSTDGRGIPKCGMVDKIKPTELKLIQYCMYAYFNQIRRFRTIMIAFDQYKLGVWKCSRQVCQCVHLIVGSCMDKVAHDDDHPRVRSEEHTSELQSRE